MDQALLIEVERQLLADLTHYGVTIEKLRFDWSESCQEGHCTKVLGSTLEERSSVYVLSENDEVVAEGWMDFIHGGGTNPLFVFWLLLSVRQGGELIKVKSDNAIPKHIWAAVPVETKALCARDETYDARWANDPLVREWALTQ